MCSRLGLFIFKLEAFFSVMLCAQGLSKNGEYGDSIDFLEKKTLSCSKDSSSKDLESLCLQEKGYVCLKNKGNCHYTQRDSDGKKCYWIECKDFNDKYRYISNLPRLRTCIQKNSTRSSKIDCKDLKDVFPCRQDLLKLEEGPQCRIPQEECVTLKKDSSRECCFKSYCASGIDDVKGPLTSSERDFTKIIRINNTKECDKDLCPLLTQNCEHGGQCLVNVIPCEYRSDCKFCLVSVQCHEPSSSRRRSFLIQYDQLEDEKNISLQVTETNEKTSKFEVDDDSYGGEDNYRAMFDYVSPFTRSTADHTTQQSSLTSAILLTTQEPISKFTKVPPTHMESKKPIIPMQKKRTSKKLMDILDKIPSSEEDEQDRAVFSSTSFPLKRSTSDIKTTTINTFRTKTKSHQFGTYDYHGREDNYPSMFDYLPGFTQSYIEQSSKRSELSTPASTQFLRLHKITTAQGTTPLTPFDVTSQVIRAPRKHTAFEKQILAAQKKKKSQEILERLNVRSRTGLVNKHIHISSENNSKTKEDERIPFQPTSFPLKSTKSNIGLTTTKAMQEIFEEDYQTEFVQMDEDESTKNKTEDEHNCSNDECSKIDPSCYCKAHKNHNNICKPIIFCPLTLPHKRVNSQIHESSKVEKIRHRDTITLKPPTDCEAEENVCKELSGSLKGKICEDSVDVCFVESRTVFRESRPLTMCALYMRCGSQKVKKEPSEIEKIYGITTPMKLATAKDKFQKNVKFLAMLEPDDCGLSEICQRGTEHCACRIERRCLHSLCICIFKHKCNETSPPNLNNETESNGRQSEFNRMQFNLNYSAKNEKQCKEHGSSKCKEMEKLCPSQQPQKGESKSSCKMESHCKDDETCECSLSVHCNAKLRAENATEKLSYSLKNESTSRLNLISLRNLNSEEQCNDNLCNALNESNCVSPICNVLLQCQKYSGCICEIVRGCRQKVGIKQDLRKESYIFKKESESCSEVNCLEHGCINNNSCILEQGNCTNCGCRISCESPFADPDEIKKVVTDHGEWIGLLLNTSRIPCTPKSVCECQEGCKASLRDCQGDLCLCNIKEGDSCRTKPPPSPPPFAYTKELQWKYAISGIISPELRKYLQCEDKIICKRFSKTVCPYGGSCSTSSSCSGKDCTCTVSIKCARPSQPNTDTVKALQTPMERKPLNFQILLTREEIKKNGMKKCLSSCLESLSHCASRESMCSLQLDCQKDFCVCSVQMAFCDIFGNDNLM